MLFKEESLRSQFEMLHPLCKIIANDFDFLSRFFGIEPVVTRINDKVSGESGVHKDLRAIDFRDEYDKDVFLYKPSVRTLIHLVLNEKYARIDKYQTALWHSFNSGPHHFHLQVAPSADSYLKSEISDYYSIKGV